MAINKGDVETVKLLLNHPKIIPCIYTYHFLENCEIKTNHILLTIESGNQEIMELLLSHPLITITEKEKKKIIEKFPKISREILNKTKMRKENKYDKADDEILLDEDDVDFDELIQKYNNEKEEEEKEEKEERKKGNNTLLKKKRKRNKRKEK